jgi:nucleoid-associated protein YgaU
MGTRSRYADTQAFVAGAAEAPVFRGRRARAMGTAAGVLEHTWKATDRLDLLALDYYGDASKWWRILDANPEVLCGLGLAQDTAVGTVILIPAAEDAGGRS